MYKEINMYQILSQGLEEPVNTPSVGDVISLSVFRTDEELTDLQIQVELVEFLGPYVHVIGHTFISHIVHFCDAKYIVDGSVEKGSEIGTLKLFSDY